MSNPDPTTHDGPIGRPLSRREDRRFLTGTARYIDDLVVPGALHARFVRSPHGQARIRAIDTAAASAMPGVVHSSGYSTACCATICPWVVNSTALVLVVPISTPSMYSGCCMNVLLIDG